MIKDVNRICPVCNDGKKAKILNTIYLGNQEYAKLPNSYDVVCCEKCGFCYADTTATMKDYDDYYKNCNVYSSCPNKMNEKESGFDVAQEAMKKFLSYTSKIVDIGSGSGYFEIKSMKSGYKNVIGIDPSIESIKNLVNKGLNGIVGNVYDEPCKELKGEIDAVFLLAVLEHLLNPKEAIKQISKYLKPSGKLFIWIPDYGNIDKNLTKQPNNFNHEHINYFSRKSLNNLLNICGFKELFCKTSICANNSLKEYQLFSVYTHEEEIVLLEKDKSTEGAISKYFEREKKISNILSHKIDEIKRKNKEIIVWGTGAFTMNLLATTSLNQCNIIAYVDNNPLKIGKVLQGKAIISPNELKGMTGIILIASMLYSKDIIKQIRDMKLTNEIEIIE